MTKENILLILWILFGFVVVTAIDSILYLFTHLVYFGTSQLGVPYAVLMFIAPIITLISYILVTFLLLKKIKTKSNLAGIYFTKFPKRLFTILVIIAIFLNPITNKLSGTFTQYNFEDLNENSTNFLALYSTMHLGIGFSRWIVLISLAIIYYKKYNALFLKN